MEGGECTDAMQAALSTLCSMRVFGLTAYFWDCPKYELRTDRKPQDFGVISTCKSRISELPMLSPDSELRQSVQCTCYSVHHNESLCSASEQECDAVCIFLVHRWNASMF